MTTPPVGGSVAAGWEPVRDVFVASWERFEEVGACVCVYLDGESVVDLHGGWTDRTRGTPYPADALQVVYSATKGVAAMAVATLVTAGGSTSISRSPLTGRRSSGAAKPASPCRMSSAIAPGSLRSMRR